MPTDCLAKTSRSRKSSDQNLEKYTYPGCCCGCSCSCPCAMGCWGCCAWGATMLAADMFAIVIYKCYYVNGCRCPRLQAITRGADNGCDRHYLWSRILYIWQALLGPALANTRLLFDFVLNSRRMVSTRQLDKCKPLKDKCVSWFRFFSAGYIISSSKAGFVCSRRMRGCRWWMDGAIVLDVDSNSFRIQ